jgi:DNA-binding NtrC family response regulator
MNLPPELLEPQTPSLPYKIDLDQPMAELMRLIAADVEQQYIRKALEKSHGNVGMCAKLCGLSRRSISAKLAQYRIDKTSFKEA